LSTKPPRPGGRERLIVVPFLASLAFLAACLWGMGAPSFLPVWSDPSAASWSMDWMWKAWASKAAACLEAGGAFLGLAGWAQSFRSFLFGRTLWEEQGALAWGMSLACFSLAVFGLGVNHLLEGPLVALLLAAGIPAGLRWTSGTGWSDWRRWQKALLAAALLPWLFEFLSPPIIWDAVLDHFRFAREVARLHQVPLHWVNHTGDIPKGAELIWAGFWSMGGEPLARASGFLVPVGVLLLGRSLARSLKLPEWPLFLLVAACPYWLALMGWGYDEGLLAFYELSSCLALVAAFRGPGIRPAAWAAAFFFLGAALGVKYTALFAWVACGSLVLAYGWGQRKIAWDWKWTLFLLAPCLPWLLRNALANGNPFYPMAAAWWGGPSGYDPGLESALWADTGSPAGLSFLGAARTWLLDFWTAGNQVGAPLAPLILMGVPFWWQLRRDREARALMIFSLVFLVAWTFFCTSLRHAAGAVLAMTFLSGLAWARVLTPSSRKVRWLFAAGLLVSLASVWAAQSRVTRPYGYALGFQDPMDRLKKNYSMDFDTFSAYEAVEKNSGPRDKTMAFGVFQTYPLRRGAFVDFFWKKPIFLQWASGCRTAGQLAEKLRREGVTTFLYQRAEAAYMSRKEKNFGLSGMPVQAYERFWARYTEPLAVFENSSLYGIRASPLPQDRPLIDLPGVEEPWMADILRADQKGDRSGAYLAAGSLVRAHPEVGEGWERLACAAGALGKWEETVRAGNRAEDLGAESLDLCRTMAEAYDRLGRPKARDRWAQKAQARARWLEGTRRGSTAFERE
ncbi:MAG TPA: hypothetical protein VFR02_05190, partial [bacterium]|nr:hypothetical protein [bacterium]